MQRCQGSGNDCAESYFAGCTGRGRYGVCVPPCTPVGPVDILLNLWPVRRQSLRAHPPVRHVAAALDSTARAAQGLEVAVVVVVPVGTRDGVVCLGVSKLEAHMAAAAPFLLRAELPVLDVRRPVLPPHGDVRAVYGVPLSRRKVLYPRLLQADLYELVRLSRYVYADPPPPKLLGRRAWGADSRRPPAGVARPRAGRRAAAGKTPAAGMPEPAACPERSRPRQAFNRMFVIPHA